MFSLDFKSSPFWSFSVVEQQSIVANSKTRRDLRTVFHLNSNKLYCQLTLLLGFILYTSFFIVFTCRHINLLLDWSQAWAYVFLWNYKQNLFIMSFSDMICTEYIYSEKIFLIQKYRSFSIQTRYLCMVQLCIFVNEFGVSNLLIQVYFYTSTSLYRSPILL